MFGFANADTAPIPRQGGRLDEKAVVAVSAMRNTDDLNAWAPYDGCERPNCRSDTRRIGGMTTPDKPLEGLAELGLDLAMDDAIDGAEVDPSARRLIDKQAQLLDLQIVGLARQNRQIAIKHLRERLYVTFELFLAAALASALILLAGFAWQASRAQGVVVRAFAIPADLADRGLSGAVVADRLLDHITAIRTATTSVRAGAAARAWRDDDIKVEIPSTGVSINDIGRVRGGVKVGHWSGGDMRLRAV